MCANLFVVVFKEHIVSLHDGHRDTGGLMFLNILLASVLLESVLID